MGVQWVSIVLKNDVGFHFPCCRAILGVQGGTDTMLMRLEDARTHGIQVKPPAEHNDQLYPQGCRHVDPGLVREDCHRLWNSRLLELAVERDLVSQPGHCDQVEPAILESKSFLWCQDPSCSFRDLDAEGVKVTAYVTAHLNVDGDVYTEAAAVSFFGYSFL